MVNEKGEIEAIVYMSKDMMRTKQIDLTHSHGEMKPHTHHGYLHDDLIAKKVLQISQRRRSAWLNSY